MEVKDKRDEAKDEKNNEGDSKRPVVESSENIEDESKESNNYALYAFGALGLLAIGYYYIRKRK